MKTLIHAFVVLIAFMACKNADKPGDSVTIEADTAKTVTIPDAEAPKASLDAIISQSQAERILGTPAVLSDSSTASRYTIVAYQGTYKSTTNEGNLYYLIEEYQHQPDAVNKYAFIKASNETSQGFKDLKGIGDEAYFHSDRENFHFAMVRRGKRVFNMKVNKVTSTTSLDEFNKVLAEVAEKL